MVRVISLAFTVTSSLLLLTHAATANAAQAGYTAKPAEAPAKAKVILRDRIWTCGEGGCQGPRSTGNQKVACALAARELGPLTEFKVDGAAIDAAALEACNKRAG